MSTQDRPPLRNITWGQNVVCPCCLYMYNSLSDNLCIKCGQVLTINVKALDSEESDTRKIVNKKRPYFSVKKNFSNSTRTILTFAILSGAILFSGVAYYVVQKNSAQQELARSQVEMKTKAVIAARNLEQFVGTQYLQVQEMAASLFLTNHSVWSAWSIERKQEYFQNNFLANSDGIDSYLVIDAQTGDTIFSGGTRTGTNNSKDIDYFQQVVKFKKPVIIPYRKSTKTGIAYMYMAAPSFDEAGKLLFVTRTRIRFDEVQKQIATDLSNLSLIVGDSSQRLLRRKTTEPTLSVGQSLGFLLVNGIGRIIATENTENLNQSIDRSFVSRILRQNKSLSVDVETIGGSSYLVAYAPIIETRGLPKLDWSLIFTTRVD